jgi:hypothetical protein
MFRTESINLIIRTGFNFRTPDSPIDSARTNDTRRAILGSETLGDARRLIQVNTCEFDDHFHSRNRDVLTVAEFGGRH